MGIDRNIALAIMREHAYRPITGNILLIGRQTMFFSPQEAVGMLKECGLPVPDIGFRQDTNTRRRDTNYISDADFFRLLGVEKIVAMDVSDYEGADIIHDLTKPLPANLENYADFILDGSTLDNVFDPAMAIRNLARLLKPNGRIISINMGSNHYSPYLILTPLWVLDYFAVNRFSDCKSYLLVYDTPGGINVFVPDPAFLKEGARFPDNFQSAHVMGVVFIATKGEDSTWNKTPVQHQYRQDWQDFTTGMSAFKFGQRHSLRSSEECFFTSNDFFFVDQAGNAVTAISGYKHPPFVQRTVRRLLRMATASHKS